MKTQHAETNTCSANHSRRHTSQIDDIHEMLDNMKIDARKREIWMIAITGGTIIGGFAFMTIILALLISMPD